MKRPLTAAALSVLFISCIAASSAVLDPSPHRPQPEAPAPAKAANHPATDHHIDPDKITAETQKDLPGKDSLGFVWWIPHEFWRASLAQEQGITPEMIDGLVDSLSNYTIVMVVDGTMDADGGPSFVAESALRDALTLVDPKGTVHSPLDNSKINATTRAMFNQMKPLLAASAGEMGRSMHVFYFPGKHEDGSPVVDPRSDGMLQVKVNERAVKFRLPLGSLMPEKVCPTCAESLNGAWKFCPWDGAALKPAPAPDAPAAGAPK
ncbi:MAG: hypothetical protein AB7G11_06585 [Phycisphaerales bacterium]